eukprot:TRINITY_DN240_c0_g1_i1.p1 TRINITY_DN240_c0_g1~~TRINITY_DN240_c0_g1_i1.p1  ORF type:complete len:398 (+),score=109.87 TRINITY_DN240_c0_g1_i1:113-1195(+)
MKIALILLTVLPCMLAQDSPADAPVDQGTAPTVPVVPVAVPDAGQVGGGDVQWCRFNEDCRIFGDEASVCNEGVCECTFPKFRYLENAWGCFPSEFSSLDQITTVFKITLTLSFTAVDCQRFFALNPTGPADLLFVLQFVMQLAIDYNIITCGSVNVAVQTQGTASDLVRLGNLANVLPAELAKFPSLADLANSPIVLTISTAQSGPCAMDNAQVTALIEGRCHALFCNTGYNITTSSAGVQLCLPVSMPKETDDDLTDAEIAGIVIGSVVGAACIIAVISVVMFGGKKSNDPFDEKAFNNNVNNNNNIPQNGTLAPPKEPAAYGEEGNLPFGKDDDHAQPNEPTGGPTTDDGTEGTIVV